MKEKEAKELVDCCINSEMPGEEDKEVLTKAVVYVSDRMELAKRLCDKLFPNEELFAEDVYSMYDYLARETQAQVILKLGGLGSKLKDTPHLGSLRPKLPDDDLN